jgi:CHAD domain-containing protein
VDTASYELAQQETDPIEAIHETRKALKRVRTTLRLLRRALSKDVYREELACFSELGRKLSPARDQHTLLEATERLGRYAAGSPYAEAVVPVHSALQERYPAQPLDEELLAELLTGLQRARGRIEVWGLDLSASLIRASLCSGVRRMARRGRAAHAHAYAEPSDENFHNWRKRVKDLYYSASLLHPLDPNRLAPLVDLLDQMGDELGDEHDLGALATLLHDVPQASGGAVPVALLLQLIARRREELRGGLQAAGRKLYSKPPNKIARRLTRRIQT